MSYITGFGGANLDLNVKSSKAIVLHDSNPGKISSSPGGAMRNILENLSRLGEKCALISAVGNDAYGSKLENSCRELSIDCSGIWHSTVFSTACYMDLLDSDGDMFAAVNDMSIMENIPESWLINCENLIKGSQAAVIDSNPTEKMLRLFLDLAGNVPVFADPVSLAKGDRIRALLQRIYLVKPNLMELELLSGRSCRNKDDIKDAASAVLDTGCFSIAVSLGSDGCFYSDRDGLSFFMKLKPAETVINATGAGDAFMAGLVSGFSHGLAPQEMVRRALACGKITVCSESTVSSEISQEKINKELEYEY